jgi:hypothetical protein
MPDPRRNCRPGGALVSVAAVDPSLDDGDSNGASVVVLKPQG